MSIPTFDPSFTVDNSHFPPFAPIPRSPISDEHDFLSNLNLSSIQTPRHRLASGPSLSSAFDSGEEDIDVLSRGCTPGLLKSALGTPYNTSSMSTRPPSRIGRDSENFATPRTPALMQATNLDRFNPKNNDMTQATPIILQQLQNASAETLLRLKNSAYLSLHEQHQAIQQHCESLKERLRQEHMKALLWEKESECRREECEHLRQQNVACLSMLSVLREPTRASASISATPTPAVPAAVVAAGPFEVPPERASGIRFWEKDDWTYSVQQNKVTQRETNKVWTYLEDDYGDTIAVSRFNAMKKHQYAVFHQLNADEMTPSKWGSACEKAKMYHRIAMCKGFPELAQGSAFWKVHQLATEYYSNFASQYVEHSGDETATSGTKRQHQGGLSSTSSKRVKHTTTATLADAPFTFETTDPATTTVSAAIDNAALSLPVPATPSPASISNLVNAPSVPTKGAVSMPLSLAVTTPGSSSDDNYDMATGTTALLRDSVHALAPSSAIGSTLSSSTPFDRPPSPDQCPSNSRVSATPGDKIPSPEPGPATNTSSDLQTRTAASADTAATISGDMPAPTAASTETTAASTPVPAISGNTPPLHPGTKRVNILAQVKIRPPSTADVNADAVPRTAKPVTSKAAAGSKADTTPKAGVTATIAKASQKKPARTVKTLQAHPTSVTLRNLCLIDFLKEHPSASKDEFDTHLSGLDGAVRKLLEDRSKQATKARRLSSRAGMGGDDDE